MNPQLLFAVQGTDPHYIHIYISFLKYLVV